MNELVNKRNTHLGLGKPRWLGVICLLILSLSALSVQADEILSGIPGAFVDIGYGARPMGMGGAYVALAQDAYAVLWNPAGLAAVRGKEVTFMYADQMALIPYIFASYSQSFGKYHGHGEAVIYTGDELLSETTIVGGYAYSLDALSPMLKRVRVGLSAKIRLVSFGNNSDGSPLRSEGSGFGFGFDLGAQWQATDRLSVGFLFRDVFSTISYNNDRTEKYSEGVPRTLVLGLATRARDNLIFVLDLDKSLYADSEDIIHFGVEVTLFRLLALRAGWIQNIGADLNRDYTLGLGIQRQFSDRIGLSFDFAYLFQDLENTPRVSTNISF